MIEIKPHRIGNCCVSVPGSKSYSHRALIAAALCSNPCLISGIFRSKDVMMTYLALKKLGVAIIDIENNGIITKGLGGNFKSYNYPIYLGDSGTSMRLLTGLINLGLGTYILVGSKKMNERPMIHLIDAMNRLGFNVSSLTKNGSSPIKVVCSKMFNKTNKVIEINCSISSQYLSSLLLISPFFKNGLTIKTTGKMVSRPYIDMTIHLMDNFGIFVEREGYNTFKIPGNQSYNAIDYNVEPDCSHACYFWAAAAITGGSITVNGLTLSSKQGDIKFLNIMEKMGCKIYVNKIGITVVRKNKLKGLGDINMSDMPDVVPTLAVVASFAKGITSISGISHLKVKESDRISAITNELRKMGIFIEVDSNKLTIRGGKPKGVIINTYNDHRIAMSFSLAGLKIPKIRIDEENCVNKSFPNFWDVFKILYDS